MHRVGFQQLSNHIRLLPTQEQGVVVPDGATTPLNFLNTLPVDFWVPVFHPTQMGRVEKGKKEKKNTATKSDVKNIRDDVHKKVQTLVHVNMCFPFLQPTLKGFQSS